MYLYCLGYASYDAGWTLPDAVFSTLEKAQAAVEMEPGDTWARDVERHQWRVVRPTPVGEVTMIRRYELDAYELDADDEFTD